MPKYFYHTLWIFVIILSSCSLELPQEVEEVYDKLPDELSYNYDIKPILSDKCFACHGPDANKREAGLRLDLKDQAYGNLPESEGKYAITPGNISKSEVVSRILSNDPSVVMPTPESHLKLTMEEKAKIIKWIDEGAQYERHWAFIPPQEIEVPDVKKEGWALNPIDHFVLNKLTALQLDPSDRAKKETLIRRVSFDLCGLPPTVAEIDAFINDKSPDAYRKMVSKYLDSPAYAERMATEWLDVARYADSDGYLDDKHRDFSPYRDWVIRSFNKNMDYKTFVTWQLAGDLVENPSQESILATAFNRLHKKNSEAGIIYEEFRTEYVADRTLTLGKAFLGLTLDCARCHDHKYDPISQKDYYRMFAFFNSTHELGTAVYGPGQTPGPALLLTNEEQDKLIGYLQDSLELLKQDIKLIKPEAPKVDSKAIEESVGNNLVSHFSFDNVQKHSSQKYQIADKKGRGAKMSLQEPDFKEGKKGQALFINEFTKVTFPDKVGWFDYTDPFSISFSTFPDTLYEQVNLFSHAEDDRLGLKGYTLFLEENRLRFVMAFSWPQNAIEVITEKQLPTKKWSDIAVTYDGSGDASGVRLFVNGEQQKLEVRGESVYKSILFEEDIHTYGFSGLQLGVVNRIVAYENGGIDEFKVYDEELSPLEVQYLHNPRLAARAIEKNSILLKEHLKLQSIQSSKYYERYQKVNKKLNSLVTSIPEIMVMGDLKEPRKTHILDRGRYDAPTDEVKPQGLSAVLSFSEELPQNRLGLSRWLFDKNNPLTARVFVNRLWAMHFGEGLVSTPDDFGNQGALPTYPKLLDYLANEFVNSSWNIKHIHKLILTSATYQQSSVPTKELQEIDPANQLLARGPRKRFTAEMVRDNALAVSELLVEKEGGKSTYPYQPEGLWDEISNKVWRYKYLQGPGDGLYRRSLYTVWKRSSPPPSMMIFDAADRTVCTVKRRTTNTPLQALVLLNGPQIIEASRVLASKSLTQYKDEDERLKFLFFTLLGRQASRKELELLKDYFQVQKQAYHNREKEARALVRIGEKKHSSIHDPADLAATTLLVQSIFNTSEGFTRY